MKKLTVAGLVLVTLLFFVWPAAHSIALRHALLWSSLLLFGYLVYRQRPAFGHMALRAPIAWYLVLTLWIFIVALFVSDEPRWSLDEIRGQWLTPLAALLVGAGAAALLGTHEIARARLLLVLIAALLVHVLYVDVVVLENLVRTGHLPRRMPYLGLPRGADKVSYLTNLLILFVLVELFLRVTARRRCLPFATSWWLAALGVALLGLYAAGMRNAMTEMVVSLLLLGALLIHTYRARLARAAWVGVIAAAIAVPVILAVVSYRTDPRWQSLVETVPIALDTETHKAWMNLDKYPLPTLADGTPVDASNYSRIAWMKEGAKLVARYPLGVGYGRNAFGHGLKKEYGEGAGHSHSGLLDLTVGIGIPGAVLWLGLLASLLVFAWRHYRRAPDYAPLLLLLVVTGFSLRMLVDSTIRDHMLQQFLFLVGLLAVLTARRAVAGAAPTHA